ncbi:MlaD family protein [Fulvivirga kasyanovii]|uniref:MCE family protein n=1 Tax=Fulvivirga kasyanovii TaxID=396812 RepID=A0ABW9RT81_9BACT|nr:MCE family protein [Fulvivirga kasyanovii]
MKVSKELKVGLFMVFSIAILYLGFNYLKGIDFFSSNDKYYAIYENVDGLNVSNPVFVNGFVVGRVSRISLLQNKQNQILVELDLSGDVILGDSATATLTGDFLGNKSILLSTGDIAEPHQPGDTIIAVLDRGIADILAESAQPVANSLEVTIKKINAILDNLTGNSDKLNRMMDGFQKTPVLLNSTIAGTKENLDHITATFDQVGKELNTTLKTTRPMLNNLTTFSDSLKRLELNRTVNEANATLAKLNQAIERLSNNDGTLGKLINNDSLYVNLNKAVENLDKLLIHIDTQPKHFFAPLGKSKEKIAKDRKKAARKEEKEN